MKWLYKFFIWTLGWKVVGELPSDLKKCIFLGAPHTSNWDGILGVCATKIWGINMKFLVKKEIFFFPLGSIIKFFGGVPLDRSGAKGTVGEVVRIFKEHDSFFLGITPEGTRSYSPEWKKGFYYIAQEANIPILTAFVDFTDKEVGLGPTIIPKGDIDGDIEKMKAFFRTKRGKYPNQGVR